jgi:SAM-dependent methyltransferase
MLNSLPISQPSEYAFVDLGCGKGLTLMLAAKYGFGSVLGVELDPRLAGIARNNIAGFGARSPAYGKIIEVVDGDAARTSLPLMPTVIFTFNSFGRATLSDVVDNLQRSLTSAPRPVFIAYYNPVHRRVLDERPFLRRLASSTRWALYEAISPLD